MRPSRAGSGPGVLASRARQQGAGGCVHLLERAAPPRSPRGGADILVKLSGAEGQVARGNPHAKAYSTRAARAAHFASVWARRTS